MIRPKFSLLWHPRLTCCRMTTVPLTTPQRERPRILLFTTRTDGRHWGGSALRFAQTRHALSRLGDVTVLLYDDLPTERDRPVDDDEVILLGKPALRRPDRFLHALNGFLGWSRVMDALFLGRWAETTSIYWDGVDVVWFFKMSTMLRWRRRIPREIAVVVDFDDLEERTRLHRLGALHHLDAWMTSKLRRRLSRRADTVCVCSLTDERRLNLSNVVVLPNTAPTSKLPIADALPRQPRLLFVGRLGYPPNLDAVTWFAEQVLPRVRAVVPSVEIRVVGPESHLLDPLLHTKIDIRGAAPTLDEHYAWSQVCVAPLRAGSGTRVKILEAMAMGRPVVSTSVGVEGIEAEPGRDLIVADGVDSFAKACIEVLTDRQRAERLAQAGRELVETRYSTQASDDAVCAAVAGARKRRSTRLVRR